jgi:hypothetical protein
MNGSRAAIWETFARADDSAISRRADPARTLVQARVPNLPQVVNAIDSGPILKRLLAFCRVRLADLRHAAKLNAPGLLLSRHATSIRYVVGYEFARIVQPCVNVSVRSATGPEQVIGWPRLGYGCGQ